MKRSKNGKYVNCEVCGKLFYVTPTRLKKNKHHTCSKNCLGLLSSKLYSKKIKTKCIVCESEIYYKKSHFKKIKHPTCSNSCKNKNQSLIYKGRKNPNTRYDVDDTFFKNIDKYKAYILGWIASDGSVRKSGFSISIHKKDTLILEKIRDLVCKELPIKKKKNKDMVSLTVSSQEIAKDLCKLLGISYGKKDKIVGKPNIDDCFLWYFIRGVFDGDGCVSSPNRHNIKKGFPVPKVNIASNSKTMLDFIENFSEIPCYRGKCAVEFYGNNAVDFLGKIYEDTEVPYLARKMDLYRDWSIYVPGLTGSGTSLKNAYFKCVKTRKDAVLPSKSRISDSGYDLTLLECVKKVGDIEYYDTGIKVQPMYGWWLMLAPRSSFSKSGYMVANHIGILDRTYTGNILVCLRKVDKSAPDLELPKRLMQIIPMPAVHIELVEVDELEDTSRGSGGFGSTGN